MLLDAPLVLFELPQGAELLAERDRTAVKGIYHLVKTQTEIVTRIELRDVIQTFIPYSDEDNIIFINAWNEWAEGNHLEPDQKWGRGYLEETKKAIMSSLGI